MVVSSPSSTLFPYTTLFRSGGNRTFNGSVPGSTVFHQVRVLLDPPWRLRRSRAVHGPRHTASSSPFSCSDRKSTRLNSSHLVISYAVFCLKKKKNNQNRYRS